VAENSRGSKWGCPYKPIRKMISLLMQRKDAIFGLKKRSLGESEVL